jgi:hypothetical protein
MAMMMAAAVVMAAPVVMAAVRTHELLGLGDARF